MLLPARMRLMSLNDGPGTTHEDVMALFDRTVGHLARSRTYQRPSMIV